MVEMMVLKKVKHSDQEQRYALNYQLFRRQMLDLWANAFVFGAEDSMKLKTHAVPLDKKDQLNDTLF